MMDLCTRYIFCIQNEFQQRFERWLRRAYNILIPNDVYRDFRIHPKVVEILPDCYVLLYKLRPELRVLLEIIIVD